MDIELNYKLIGKRLREIRKKRGYTQEEVSERAGISAQHCSGIECGSAKVSLPALVRLCNALDATPVHTDYQKMWRRYSLMLPLQKCF